MQSVELFKTAATYAIAVLVIVGGGWLLVIPTQVEPGELLPFLTGAIGTVLGYVFAERQTATTQKGNGLERTMLEAVHRRLDTELPAIRQEQRDARTSTPVAAERVDVIGDQVNVTRDPGAP